MVAGWMQRFMPQIGAALRLFLFAGIGFAATIIPAAAEGRFALVIGNDTYRNVPALQKARADAQSVGAALQSLGFAVTTLSDADFSSFNSGLSNFAERVGPGDIAIFFYAGHGFAIDGRNYLLPTDVPAARVGQSDLVRRAAIAADEVTGTLRSRGARTVVAILDACRDNPFAAASGTRSLAGGRGLARPVTENGEFILMSAGTAQTALDRLDDSDGSQNSVFTRILLKTMSQPGLDMVGIARQTREQVQALALTRGQVQTPSYYDDGAGAFIFVPPGSEVTIRVPPSSGGVPTRAGDDAREELFWRSAERGGSRPELEAYLAKVKSGEFRGTFSIFADARLARLDADDRAAAEKTRQEAQRRTDEKARDERIRLAEMTGPKKIFTEGMNGTAFVRGTFTRTGPGEWIEENTQTAKGAEPHFRVIEQSPTVITVVDPTRNLFLQFDLQQKSTRLRSGANGQWFNFYGIKRVER